MNSGSQQPAGISLAGCWRFFSVHFVVYFIYRTKYPDCEVTTMTEEELMAAIDAQMTRGVSRLKVEFTENMPEGERKEAYHHGRCDVGSPWGKGLAFDCDAIDETIEPDGPEG